MPENVPDGVFLRWVATISDPLSSPLRASEWVCELGDALSASRGRLSVLWASTGEFLIGLGTQLPHDDPWRFGRRLNLVDAPSVSTTAGTMPGTMPGTASGIDPDGVDRSARSDGDWLTPDDTVFDWDELTDAPVDASTEAVIRWAAASRLGQGMSLSAVADSIVEIDAAARAMLRRWRVVEPYSDIRGFVQDEGWSALAIARRLVDGPRPG